MTTIKVLVAMTMAAALLLTTPTPARAQNAISIENALPGNPPSEWQITGAGHASIQGFATDVSVDQGQTISFKISTPATSYRIDIYRIGWYGGLGARKVATVLPSVSLPQGQPQGISSSATGLLDCGNWAVSASWSVPSSATSGVYIAKLVRTDPEDGRASHIVFVVRDDNGGSDLLFQTSETTWQAYNDFGGNSLYTGAANSPPVPRAHKVSFNRPYSTRAAAPEDWVFNAEFPMIRWLEANGFDVSYSTDIDTDRRGAELLEHRAFLSVGHDEYWSAGQRTAVEAARNAGVHLAFFSGNEIYWKIRWENSVDGSNTPYRTMVCYKEGTLGEITCGGKCDPLAGSWTGLWRDGCSFSPPADGCNPENTLSGQISWVGTTDAIRVPGTYAPMRLWRNTTIASLAPMQEATLSDNTLGYEWDPEQYPDFYPVGRVHLSETQSSGETHRLSLYRHASGAMVFGAGTVQWSWGLDGTHDRGTSTPDLRMQQMTVNLFAEMGAQPATPRPGIVTVAATGDVASPVSVIGSPLNGGTVQQGVATIISGTATDAAGVVVAVEVSVDGGATWARANGTASWTYSWTPFLAGPATIRTRAVDDLANLETPGPGITVTADPAPPAVCPCTAWAPGTVPGTPNGHDPFPIEVGVRFRADVNGEITGVRFYKASNNTGTHIGKLYTNAGVLLASNTFTGETASGWQEVSFASPVPITQGTTYVASVWMPAGNYSFTENYFQNGGVDRTPLHLLQDGVDGGNGLFNYGSQAFPSDTYNSSNYWVDVVFDTESGPDVTPPTIIARNPGNGAGGVAVSTTVAATFNEAMNAATISGSTFELQTAAAQHVAANVSYSPATRTATLTPTSALEYSSAFTAGVTTAVQDAAGNPLAAPQNWTFTTSAPPPPPPNDGPGGPILVISSAANPFSRYPVEILRNEGLNAFTAMDLSLVTPAVLAAYDVVVLGECAVSAADVTMLTDWTTAGGTLIAFRPDVDLAPLLGITPAGGTLDNAYLLVHTASGPGVGIVSETMQFHGTADRYTLSGATAVATLYSNATTATANPAVTTRSVGPNGGRALAFTYDLARSVVYTRQGNPAWAGTKRDGQAEPIRSDDLFYGDAFGDPQPDWIDFNKIAIPQADEQQRLFANAILLGNLHRNPLPRFWYLPSGHKAAVVMTGDNHSDEGMAPRFEIYRSQSPAGCSVEDWECVRATGYMYIGSTFTPAQASFYDGLGFEVAVHINTNCARFTAQEFDDFVATQSADFADAFPALPPQVSNRNHCIAWSDWSSVAEVQAARGIRLDTNYYYWPASWVQNRPGFFTGSGMPMRFAKTDGTLIDCYQAVTQLTDESAQTYPSHCDALFDRALGPLGYYGVFTTNIHFDTSPHLSSDAIVASALARGIPVVSAKQMLTWLDGRNGSSFSGISWNTNQLGFSISVGAGARNLRAMLPMFAAVGQLTSLTRDGNPVAWTTETIKGIAYAFFPADAGAYTATYLVDTTPPVISAVVATPNTDGTATITWTTDELSDSQVDYGTAPGSLTLNAGSATMVTSHEVELSGLASSTLYYYRVRSTDAASNMATEPPVPSAPLEFTMPSLPCFEDQTAAQFAQGTTGAGSVVTESGDGEVTLAPAVSEDFSGSALPAGWGSGAWTSGGTATVSGGVLTVNGAAAYSGGTFGPGRSLEFEATFLGDPFQNIGFAANSSFDAPWVVFGTGAGGDGVYARASGNGDIFVSSLGTPRRYRIDWNANDFTFFVDGAQVAVIGFEVGTPMLPIVSDFDAPLNGSALTVNWLRLTPYASAGSYTSRVFDSGGSTTWDAATWSATLPSGTSLSMFQRTGSTPVPDGSWTAFTSIPSSGSNVGANGRYIQYRADLATSVVGVTPVLDAVQFACTPCGGPGPAVITDLAASGAAGGSGGRANLRLTWSGVTSGHTVAVYRKAYGDYPLYRPTHGGTPEVPATPAAAITAGWTLTGVTATTELDAPPTRGFWYHVAFVTNGCGQVSAPSNLTAGALDYILGDVSDGIAVCAAGGEAGDGVVSTADLSTLGDNYGQSFAPTDDRVCFDVGPTVDYGIRSRPVPDGLLDFEDLVIYALNFEVPLPAIAARAAAARASADRNQLIVRAPASVRAGERFDVILRFLGTGSVHALSTRLAWDATVAEFGEVMPGELLSAHGGVAYSRAAGAVDAAVLGAAVPGIAGEGDLVVVSFRALRDGDPAVRLASALARDGANLPVELGETPVSVPVVDHATGIRRVFPNPFRGSLSLSFTLARETRTRLVVFDIAGRAVRHLEDGSRRAGLHVVTWDGQGDGGRPAPAGLYVVTFEAGGVRETRRVLLIR